MKSFESYVMGIVLASIIVSILMSITPKGSMRALIGVIAGFLMVLVLCRPLLGLQGISLDDLWQSTNADLSLVQEKYQLEQDKLLKELIESKTSAYIHAKAQALGVTCRTEVTLSEDSPPVPISLLITSETPLSTDEQRMLAEQIAADLGIPSTQTHFRAEQ